MPQIPEFGGDLQVHPGQGAAISPGALAAPGAALAHAGEQVGEEMGAWAERYANARRAADASNVMANLSSQLNDSSFKWSKTPDRQAALAGFAGDVQAIQKNTIAKISDPLVQQYVTERFNSEASARELETGQRAFGLESSKRAGELDTNLAAFAQSAAGADDPLTKAKIGDDGIAAIKGAVAGGWITPEEGAQRQLKFRSQMQEVAARQMIDRAVQTQDPNDALAASHAINDDSQFPGMDPETRERLAYRVDALNDRLMNRAIAKQAHEDAVSEKLLRQTQAHNESVILAGIYGGQTVDNATLQKLADGQQISPEGLEAIHSARDRQAEGSDDASTVAHLWAGIDNHQARPADIYAAMTAGKVKGSTGAEMMRTLDRGPESATEKSALETLNTIFRGDSQYGVKSAVDPAIAAQGRLEFARRVNAGEDPQKVMPDILQRYVGGLKAPVWLPAPQLGAVDSAQKLDAIAVATVKAHQAHQISDAAYATQTELLNRYRAFYQNQAAIQAAAQPAGKGSTNAASGGQQARP